MNALALGIPSEDKPVDPFRAVEVRPDALVRHRRPDGREGRNRVPQAQRNFDITDGQCAGSEPNRKGEGYMRGIARTMCMRVVLAAAALSAGAAQAQDSAASFPTVQPAEQAARDSDRVRILHDELAREQDRLAEAVRRRAERVAARDAQGEKEADAAHQRSTAAIAALRREIELTGRTARGAAPAVAASTGTPSRRPAPRPAAEAPRAAWWDVYGKAPRRGEAGSQQLSVASEPALAPEGRAW